MKNTNNLPATEGEKVEKKPESGTLKYAINFALNNFNYYKLCQKFPKGGIVSNEEIKAVIEVATEVGYKIARNRFLQPEAEPERTAEDFFGDYGFRIGDSDLPYFYKAIEKYTNLKQKSKWISVKVRLPDCICILAFTGGLIITLTYIGESYYTGDGNKWCSEVTHWMPLPKQPIV
jgi:hypothetical protein